MSDTACRAAKHWGAPCTREGVVLVRVNETGETFAVCRQHARVFARGTGYAFLTDSGEHPVRLASYAITVGVTT